MTQQLKQRRRDGTLVAGRSFYSSSSKCLKHHWALCVRPPRSLNNKKPRSKDMSCLLRCTEKVIVPLSVLVIIGVFAKGTAVEATHFRGGTITWTPGSNYSATNKRVEFSYRLAWSYSHARCDANAIAKRKVIGDGDLRWACTYGCSGDIASAKSYCTDFSVQDNWSTTENTFDHVFTDDGLFEISFMHCCWIDTLMTSGTSEWGMTAKVLLGMRSDIGRVNTAPVVTSSLTIRLEIGIPAVVSLNVSDDDNDSVICRLGRHFGECGMACALYEDLRLNETTCQVTYLPKRNISGNLPLSIVVEDHHKQEFIRVGKRVLPANEALSSVPFQFVIQVGDSPPAPRHCVGVQPQVKLDIDTQHVVVVKTGRKFEYGVRASTCDSSSRILDFDLSGPEGVKLITSAASGDGTNYTKLQWEPKENQKGKHRICVEARDSNGLKSEQKCSTVVVEQGLAYCRANEGMRFMTFDGFQYLLAGGCKYQLVITTFDPLQSVGQNLQPFNITISNDLESGQPRINNIQIIIGMRAIQLQRDRKVLIDGVLADVPIRLPSVYIYSSGKYVVVSTDSGMILRFDGQSAFDIGLPPQYAQNVRGLCGNFNGISNDDLSEKMTPSSNFTHVESGNRFEVGGKSCSKSKVRDEPLCEGQKRASSASSCSIISASPGCFASCHSVVRPQPFYDACVQALCSSTTSANVLKSQVSAYADACQLDGAAVCDWRSHIGAVLKCSPNSHYNACGSTEPVTCANIDSSPIRASVCIEGCVCNEGYVLSGNNCVLLEQCGCFLRGRYVKKGFQFRTSDCQHQCMCSGNNKTQCKPVAKCKDSEICGPQADGFMRCINRTLAPATCKAIGDPHYQTFDGATYDSMSTCAHILVRSRPDASITPFSVITINEQPRLNNIVSHVGEVQITVGADKRTNITLSQGSVITYNGDVVFPGTTADGVTFTRTTHFLTVSFDFGLVIRWDGVDRLRVSAWNNLRNQVEGLCGNYDGDPSNDFTSANSGGLITNVDKFVNSWRVTGLDIMGNPFPEPPRNASELCLRHGLRGNLLQQCLLASAGTPTNIASCRDRMAGNLAVPCKDLNNLTKYQQDCYVLIDPSGPFSSCHSVFNPFPAYNSCLFDLCAYEGNQTFRERILSSYDYDCRERMVIPKQWRNDSSLVLQCGTNSQYTVCMPQCQPTCDDPNGAKCLANIDLGSQCEEGCRCLEGFVRNVNGSCIPQESCGCLINGRYQLQGFIYKINECAEECRCVGKNQLQCSSVQKCGHGFKCRSDSAGFQRCVKKLRRKATCKAVTDPHYMTFDRKTFDSMGMCSYIMVRNKANATNLNFTVVAVNEQPNPSQIVSHVKEVFVHFAQNMTMRFMAGPVLQLNGVAVNPGLKRDGVEIRKAGRFVLVDWDFGLTVRWDGEDRLRISAWSPLRYQVEGVCGNFDDNQDNDLTGSDGQQYSLQNVDEFVNSWIIEGYGAEGCPRNIRSDVLPRPCADPDVLAAHRNACFVIADPNGPLKNCQAIVDPEASFQACVYDQCAYNGDPKQKDRIISSYILTCLDEDEDQNEGNVTITVPDWRKLENTSTPECPPHSVFVNCLPSCQPSCDDPDSSICLLNPRISTTCVEGCQALEGFLQSGDQFVTLRHCGCVMDGEYYKNGQTFLTSNCSSTCTCNATEVTCVPAGCTDGRECRANRNGDLACLPLRKKTCKVWGNGHIITFDDRAYDLRMPCSYTLASAGGENNHGGVTIQMTRSADNATTIEVQSVNITFSGFNTTVTLMKTSHGVQVKINEENARLEWKLVTKDGHQLLVQKRGRFIVLSTSKGHRVEFDGNQLLLKLPVTYFGLVRGLCGNFNGDPQDDLVTLDRTVTNNVELFANSHKTKHCPELHVAPNLTCTSDDHLGWKEVEMCGIITNTSGPLSACNRVIRSSISRRYQQDCIADLCNAHGSQRAFEAVIASYAHQCLSQGIRLCDWRKALDFPLSCPDNTHYEGCAPACPPVCGRIPDSDDDDCTFAEYCVCNKDYVLKDGVCVPAQSCGCQKNNVTLPYGATFMNENCTQSCTCYGQDRIVCQTVPGCRKSQICRPVRDGAHACVQKPRKRTRCEAVAGRRYKTFDGTTYHSNTSCSYTMVKSSTNAKSLPAFSVVVMNQRLKSRILQSRISEIKVSFGGETHELVMKPKGTVTIDGKTLLAGMTSRGVNFTKVGEFLVASFEFGLVIRWNGEKHLYIDVWRQLHGVVEGLCGDFDDLPFNDFVTSSGIVTDDVASFVSSWKVSDYNNTSCEDRVPGQENPPCATADELTRSRRHCNILLDLDGPFKPCHQFVEQHSAYDDCVFDSCISGASIVTENRVIHSYAKRCHENGGPFIGWIQTTGRVPACPEHAFYNECISQCQPSCSDRNASVCQAIELLGKDCVEGCQCVDGYLYNDGKCVKDYDCGCLTPDKAYIKANSSGYDSSCRQFCNCTLGVLSCEQSSCSVDQYCGTRENVHGCHWLDECEYGNGGCSHSCNFVANKTVCTCPSNYTLKDNGKTCVANPEKQLLCEDGQSEKEKYSKWSQEKFKEWMKKLERYMTAVSGPAGSTICGSRWTEWLDRDDPGGDGDEESLSQLRHEFPHMVCANPVAVEARMTDGRLATASGNIVTMNAQQGLICRNSDQPVDRPCGDFEVRFLCLETLF